MSESVSELLDEDVSHDTAYCTYCPKLCRFSCPVAEAECRETVTPWGLMRLLEFTRTGDFELDAKTAETFYHCTGCLRCQTWCRHDNDVPRAMWSARRWVSQQGLMPQALESVVEGFAVCGASSPGPRLDPRQVAQIFDASSPVAFFPDCKTRQNQPELVLMVGQLLERLFGFKVRLLTNFAGKGQGCCGFELRAAGAQDALSAHHERLEEDFSGVRHIVTDCAPFVAMQRNPKRYLMTHEQVASWPRLEHIIETLDTRLADHPPQARLATSSVMLHDSCYVGRHLNLYDATRRVAAALFETPLEEFHLNRDQATCCGGANLYDRIAPQGSLAASQALFEQMEIEGGQALLCGQANCKHALGRVQDDVAIDVLEAACMAYEIDV